MSYILAIDQSTAGTKAVIFDADGEVVTRADIPHRQIVNDAGWIEHDPEEIYRNTVEACRQALAQSGMEQGQIVALGISNQRETALCWDRETGKPCYNAIVWQCGRAVEITEKLQGQAGIIRRRTGLALSPFFSAAKYAWMLKYVPEAQELAGKGRLCCGNIDSWLLYRLTEGRVFKTDYSNASRTQLLNLDTLAWDGEVAALFGLNSGMLAEICPSDSLFGDTDIEGVLSAKIPIHAVMGDSHAALYANGCHQRFTAKATFGTGTSVMMNVGAKRPQAVSGGVVESLAWGIGGEVCYVLEGNINYSGAIIRWLVQDVGLLENSRQSGTLAAAVPDTGGVYLVPAFSGLGAPYWQNDVRAILCGLSMSTKKEHIVRAAEEAIAYQIKDIVTELNACCTSPLKSLCVDGGATKDTFLMGFVADILGVDIRISRVEELSAAGAAYLAAIRTGCSTRERIFDRTRHLTQSPRMDTAARERLYTGWKQAVSLLIR